MMKASFIVALLALGCAGLLLGSSSPATPGDYHQGSTLRCSQCHVMHAQQSHGYNPDGGGHFQPPVGTHEYLLRNEINELCLYCHDDSWAPDVFEDNGLGVRQAGALNDINSAGPDYFPTTGHTLYTTDTAPGGTWNNPDGLTCVDCHHPHGRTVSGSPSTQYRNLDAGVGGNSWGDFPVTYAASTNNLSLDVFERAAGAYDIVDVDFNEPDPTGSAYADWCKGCHTNFHGAVGGSEIGGSGSPPEHFIRHPSATVNIGDVGGGHSRLSVYQGHTNRVKVMDPAGVWDPNASPNDLTPSCFSCHKAHGNKNAFGLIYMRGTGTVTEEGDDGNEHRDLCKQCHGQGG